MRKKPLVAIVLTVLALIAVVTMWGTVSGPAVSEQEQEYEFVSQAKYYNGKWVKVRVGAGLSADQLKQVILSAAKQYGGFQDISVGVYQTGEDVEKSGYTAAMGTYHHADEKWDYEFADAYIHPEQHSSPSIVGRVVQLNAGAQVSNAPDYWLEENILFTAEQPASATVIEQKTFHFSSGADLTVYKIQVETPTKVSGWIMEGEFLVE